MSGHGKKDEKKHDDKKKDEKKHDDKKKDEKKHDDKKKEKHDKKQDDDDNTGATPWLAELDAALRLHKQSELADEIDLTLINHKGSIANFTVKFVNEDDVHEFSIDVGAAYAGGDTTTREFVCSTEDELLEENWLIHMIQFSTNAKDLKSLVAEAAQRYFVMTDEDEDDDDDDGDHRGKQPTKSKARSASIIDDDDDDVFGGVPQSGFALSTGAAPKKKSNAPRLKSEDFFTGDGSKSASERLIKDLQAISEEDTSKFGYTVETMDDNLYKWEARLFDFDGDLAKDMKKRGIDAIKLELTFPKDYPFSPPFIRVREPRFQFHTGHVTIGGSICMQALTKSGWSSAFDCESILVQIRTEMMAGGARLDARNTTPYSLNEAQSAFDRVAAQHGWN